MWIAETILGHVFISSLLKIHLFLLFNFFEQWGISSISAVFYVLQLLEPGRYMWLLKALYGLLMLLPQVFPLFPMVKH